MPRARILGVLKFAAVGVAGLLALVSLIVLAAAIVLQGPRLGRLIESTLPDSKGKMRFGGVTWQLRALADIVTDTPSPISLDGLQIIDPEGTVVLDVPHLEAKVKLRTILGGSISIHDLRVPVALWRFSQLKAGDGIGFLEALASKAEPPPEPAVKIKKPEGTYFELVNAELGDLTAIFDFPGTWGLELRHVHARASLKQSGVDPLHPTFGFDAGPVVAEGGGFLRIMDNFTLPFDRVAINRVATTPEAPDDILLDLAEARTGRSVLTGKGTFTGIYGETSVPGINLHAVFSQAGDALTAVAANQVEGLKIDGPSTVVADLTDTFEKMKVAATFRDLDVRYDSYRALGLDFDFRFDAGAGRLDVTKFGFGAPGGGTLGLDAHLDTNRLALDAGLRFTDFVTDSYVPRALRPMAGGRLAGRVDARADIGHKSARLTRVDLRFARPRANGLPRQVRVSGSAALAQGRVKTDGLTVAVAGAEATARGSVDLERQLIDLGLAVVAADLGRLLGEMGLPPLAKEARIDAQAQGTFDDPSASGEAVVRGVSAGGRKLPELVARFGLERGVARLDRLSGPAFGGRIEGRGTLKLWEKKASRPLRSPVVDFRLDAHDLDLAMLAGIPDIGGRLSLRAEAHGPLDAVTALATIPAGTPISAFGGAYKLGPVDIGLAGQTLAIRALHVQGAGPRGGGALDVQGKIGLQHQDLDLEVVLDRLPLAGLPGVADAGVPVSGFASARLHIGGRPDRPQLAGTVDLIDVAARGVALGGGHLVFAPTEVGAAHAPGVHVTGRLFDRFDIDARAALTPNGPSVQAEVAFRRVEIETLLPELLAFGDGRGIVSGQARIDLEPGRPLAVELFLPELWLSIARAIDGPNGETTMKRVRVEAKSPLHVAVRGDQVVLDEVHFATDGGDLKVEGRLDGKRVQGSLLGYLDLELLQPFLGPSSPVERLSGSLRLDVEAGGTVDQPDLRGQMTIATPLRARPRGLDRDVVVASGTFSLDTANVRVQGLAITVDGSTMRLSGHAGLGAGFTPTTVQADVDGDVSARLLAFVAPDAVTDAQGKAHVRAQVRGTFAKPEIRGRLDLGAIDFRLRDMGIEVQVQSGIVEVSNDGVVLHNVKVVLDDQGVLVIGASGVRAGRVQFQSLFPFKPGLFDLPLHGEKLTYRSAEVFEIDDLAFDLDLSGDLDDGFELAGEVRLVSGRYLQDFNVKDLVITPRVNESSVRPFYEGKPLLEDLALDLNVRTVGEGFVVQNNIAPEIHLDILLHVGHTLSEPQLAGDVRPTDGRFNIPFMRGDFDLVPNVNHVTFVATKSLAQGETPDLNIEAQNLVTDATGVDHLVYMRIRGPMREAQIDLSSDDGLSRNQAATLLLTGRTTSESQRLTTSSPTVGANVNTAASVAGQATRDTVDNLMQPYIDDTFFRLTGFNLRLTVGPDGFEGRVRKRISRRLNFQTSYLQGFQNNSLWRTQFDAWIVDYVSFASGLEQIRTSAQTGVPETLPLNYNAELRLDYAIRRR